VFWVICKIVDYDCVTYYAVADLVGNVTEFNSDELFILSLYVHIVGCENPEKPRVAVLYALLNTLYSVQEWLGRRVTDGLSVVEKKALDDLGYIIEMKKAPDKFYNPSILVRTGMYAVVTDRGRLLYLNAGSRKCVVLGDICSSLYVGCLQYHTPVYVFDDRIESVNPNFDCRLFGQQTWDIRGLHNQGVRCVLERCSKKHDVVFKE